MNKLHLVTKIWLLGNKFEETNSKMIIERVINYIAKQENYRTLSYLNNLFNKDPNNNQAWLCLGIVNRLVDKLNKAIKCFETAVELSSS